jgi:hypothetical protein
LHYLGAFLGGVTIKLRFNTIFIALFFALMASLGFIHIIQSDSIEDRKPILSDPLVEKVEDIVVSEEDLQDIDFVQEFIDQITFYAPKR